ncbi:hypothetical protein PthBH41_37990 (plasmid) [Parageobacillus thermoglucosidasius]|nr:hypothetical protein PthBH41_37990 [Parageobacillus thermoglucosidasius]
MLTNHSNDVRKDYGVSKDERELHKTVNECIWVHGWLGSWSRPDQFMRSLHKIMRGNEMDDRRMLIDLKDMLREKTKKLSG